MCSRERDIKYRKEVNTGEEVLLSQGEGEEKQGSLQDAEVIPGVCKPVNQAAKREAYLE